MSNPLFSDRHVDFLLREVLDLPGLLALPAFVEHSEETCAMYMDACRKVARQVLLPSYGPVDAAAPGLEAGGQVRLHRDMHEAHRTLVELGVLTAARPEAVGGTGLPMLATAASHAYLMAGNLAAYALEGLTTGAARLIESFGDDDLRARFMRKMYDGEWTGTMALTEPQAGSSLSDVATKATPAADGTFRISGTKVFISGGAHDVAENIIHLTLARIEGAPAGIKGVSLFAVPAKREVNGKLVDNDVLCSSVFHKVGWRGLPSVQLSFGDRGECHGWLVGAPHQGIKYMFQMMNEARLMVGLNAVASASVAFHAAIAYAQDRPQGRPLTAKDPTTPQIPIIEHADVRRMLLRQKAIVEGGLALLLECARLTDLSEHHPDPAERKAAFLLLDLLTPIAKTFPAEYGFEANTLAIQIHGGYGYTSEYPVEAWWRDQKLNTIHEGTSGIQGLDLLGRKMVAEGGAGLRDLAGRVTATLAKASQAGLPATLTEPLSAALQAWLQASATLGAKGATGDVDGMLRHSADYMSLASVTVVGWMWLRQAVAATNATDRDLAQGVDAAARYWMATEATKAPALAARIASGEDSYAALDPAWL
ncbi:MAG: acyl-CoA dehydrogenase [Myxococcales bacterium]|nr:acyl-CoA dehydrogenase [Myxococcales bacterium]MCB9651408.1 acyl-CoA dehydrogenase [Deltaproteobacteria bacterium]